MKTELTKEEISVDGYISLTKLTGKQVKDIVGFVSDNWGVPFFEISKIVFDDDSVVFVEGEHDCPYIPNNEKQPNMDYETLESLVEREEEEEE